MASRNDPELQGIIKSCEAIAHAIENQWGCFIEMDARILEEAVVCARGTLSQVKIANPNEVKQAAHYAFWIRKLKPFRIVNIRGLVDTFEYLAQKGCVRGHVSSVQDVVPPQRQHYINELISRFLASGICRQARYPIKLTAPTINDFAISLRYHSFSPSAITGLLAAHLDR